MDWDQQDYERIYPIGLDFLFFFDDICMMIMSMG